MSTAIAELLSLTETGRDQDAGAITYRAEIGTAFTIGPKVHGGSVQLLVGYAARMALADLAVGEAEGERPLVISSDYLAAPDPAEVALRVSLVKRGRTVSLARVDAIQNERVVVASTVTLGRPDHGEPVFRGPTMLDDLPPDPPAGLWPLPEGAPTSPLHNALDLTLDPLSLPALRGEQGEPTVRGWIRAKTAADGSTDARTADSLHGDFPILVCDASPPVVMNLGHFGWAPTVQLSTYVQRVAAPGWLRFGASTSQVGNAMFAEDHLVVDANGVIVAQSRQLALIPAKRTGG